MAASLLSPDAAVFKLEKAGLKQHQIAALLGIAQGTVSKIKSKRYTEVSSDVIAFLPVAHHLDGEVQERGFTVVA